MKMKLRWLVFGVLLAAGLLLAAPGPAAAQISDDAVKIGVLNDMSGLYADITGSGSVIAAQMAVEDFGGKVRGKPIQVISGDHQNQPDLGSAIARKWFDEDKLDVIVDLPTSSVALAVQEIARQRNKVLLISGGGSSDLTGPACAPYSIHWAYDTYALAHVAGQAIVKQGGDTWFFITADYAFGKALERDAAAEVKRNGGKVLGSVYAPLNTTDFSSYLIEAQASKAKVIALANAAGDTINSIKQAREFGIAAGGQRIVGLLVALTDTHSLGLEVAQGLLLTEGFYWDMNDETRAWSKRFYGRHHAMPTNYQAGVYSALMHYLHAIDAIGTDDAKAVVAKMKAKPVNDFYAKGAYVREDGRMVHDMYLMQVKTPQESQGEWDLYTLIATVPGDQAYRPISEGHCPFIQASNR